MPRELTEAQEEHLRKRVRDICRGIRIEAPTPGATAAWNDVLVPHIVEQQLREQEQAHGSD